MYTVNLAKMHSDDRTLVLKPKPGEKTKNSTGIVDKRLFTGGNSLHAIKNKRNNFWYLQYEQGLVPQALKQQFTSFNKVKAFADDYFSRRGLEITEVIDNHG